MREVGVHGWLAGWRWCVVVEVCEDDVVSSNVKVGLKRAIHKLTCRYKRKLHSDFHNWKVHHIQTLQDSPSVDSLRTLS